MSIFNDGALVDVNVRYWSGAKALTAEDLGFEDQEIVDAFKLGRKYLIPERIVKAWRKVEGKARYVVDSNSFPFPIGNARFITKKRFSRVVDRLQEHQDAFMALVDDLVENYDAYKAEMVPVYRQAAETAYENKQSGKVHEFGLDTIDAEKEQFINDFLARVAGFYPSVETLRGSFSLTWDVYAVALPRMRITTDEAIIDGEQKRQIAIEEYQAQVHQKINTFIDDVVRTLRKETLELCGRVQQSIKEGKVITTQSLQAMKDFTEKFESLNFVGDSTVEDQLESLRKEFLDVHTRETINDDVDVMDEFKRRINLIAEAASNITDVSSVTGEYHRKIQLEEEPEAKAA